MSNIDANGALASTSIGTYPPSHCDVLQLAVPVVLRLQQHSSVELARLELHLRQTAVRVLVSRFTDAMGSVLQLPCSTCMVTPSMSNTEGKLWRFSSLQRIPTVTTCPSAS